MTDSKPSPVPNRPVPAWGESEALEEALQKYLDHDPPDPTYRDVWRAIATIPGEYQRDAFINAFGLDNTAERPCIRRLITGEKECPYTPLEADSDPQGPPHAPPSSDHAIL